MDRQREEAGEAGKTGSKIVNVEKDPRLMDLLQPPNG